MNMMMVIVPRYGAYLMSCTGAMMLFSDFLYFWLLPSRALKIPFEGKAFLGHLLLANYSYLPNNRAANFIIF